MGTTDTTGTTGDSVYITLLSGIREETIMTYYTHDHHVQLRESSKEAARRLLRCASAKLSDRVTAAHALFWVYFHRSIGAYWKFTREHPQYGEFAAMLLSNESFWRKELRDDVYAKLVEEFGVIPGEIPAGCTYYYDPHDLRRKNQWESRNQVQSNA